MEQDQADRYSVLLGAFDEAILLLEFAPAGEQLDFRIVETNQAFEKQSGVSDAIGRTLRELRPGIENEWLEQYAAVLETGAPRRFHGYFAPRAVWLEAYAARVEGTSGARVLVIFNDISDRMENDQLLRRSRDELKEQVESRTVELQVARASAEYQRERLHSMFIQSPTCVAVVCGAEHVYEFANDAYLVAVNRTNDQLLGKNMIDVLPQLPLVGWYDQLARVYETGQPSRLIEWRAMLKRGNEEEFQETYWNVALNAVRGPVGEIEGISINATEVTEQVLARRQVEDLLDDRAALIRELVDAQEKERQRITRELHDEMGQHLTALKIGLERLGASGGGSEVQQLLTLVARVDDAVDRLARELRPAALDALSLEEAMRGLLDELQRDGLLQVHTQIASTDGQRLPGEIETVLYRVLQEALTNVRKHSAARNVSVVLQRHPDHVQLTIEDDGRGFDAESLINSRNQGHFGLLGMRERLALVSGSFSVESTPRHGTSLYIRIPVQAGGAS